MKWVAVVMVGWYWVGGWVFLLLFFSYSFNGLLCPLGKRGNLNGEREKKKNIYIYIYIVIHNYNSHVYLHGYCSKCVNIHIFTPTDVGSFGGKLYKF